MTDLNEKDLIRKAKQGDMLAFEELILKHEKIVYNLALRMMNHSEDAQDIAQEVFLKAYRSLANFDERAAFSTWLYRITHNTCIDAMRKRKGKQTYSLEEEVESEDGSMQRQIADEGDTPEESLLRAEQKSEILQALDTLSEETVSPHIHALFDAPLLNPFTGSSHSDCVRGLWIPLLIALREYSEAFLYAIWLVISQSEGSPSSL